MATYIKPEAIKDASLPISKVAAMSENERLAFLVSLGLGNLTEVPNDGKVYGRTHGEWVEAEKAKGDYKQLIDYTVTENTSQIEFLKTDAGEDITKYRDLIIDCILVYDASNTTRQLFIRTKDLIIVRSGGICDVAYKTHYRIRIKLGNRYTSEVYIESHTNSWSNPQFSDNNYGRNLFCYINQDPEYVKLLLESSTFLVGEKLTIYGR